MRRSTVLIVLVSLAAAGCGLRTSPPLAVGSAGEGLAVPARTDAQPPEVALREHEPRVAAAAQPPPRIPHSALLIGINETAGSPTLRGAVGDALTMHTALLGYGFLPGDIHVLLDASATRAAILDAIAQLARRTPPDGRAVFAFAGHTRRPGGQNALVAADGKLITARELARALGAVQAPMWAAFPTCYAAGFRIPGIVGPGRIVTFASDAGELAWEAVSLQRSYLVHYMVKRGMVENLAPLPTVEDAFEYARASLAKEQPDIVPLQDDRFEGSFWLAGSSWRPPPAREPLRDDEPASEPTGRSSPPPQRPDGYAAPAPTPPAPSWDMRVCAGGMVSGNC